MVEPVRDYADKVMRDALLKPDNLRDLLSATVPQLVNGFNCAHAHFVPPEFLLPDGRGREGDLLFAEAFHAFAPAWSPLFWELPKHSVDDLLGAEEAFLQAMAVVRVEDADRAEFEKVYRATLSRLDATVGKNRSRWADLVYLIIGWITHRRPAKERPELFAIAQEVAGDAQQREEIDSMVETWADQLLAEGERRGERKGSAELARKFIVRSASKHLGAADAHVEAALNAISDLDRLERIFERSSEALSWTDLLATA